jgi:hypothetical protein
MCLMHLLNGVNVNNVLMMFLAGALLASSLHARAGGVDPERLLFDADFDAEPLDQPIGTGGPELGQPVSVDPDLSAVVRATPLPTPSLEFSHAAAGFARTARFEFLDGEEVIHGDLVLRFVFQAGQLDHFSLVYVRERTSSARQFLTLSLAPDGRIVANDESGDPAIEIGTYLPGIDYLVQVVFHMDEHSWDLDLDGVPIVTGRVHGIEDRGIGAVLFGTDHQTDPGSVLLIDRLRVRRGDAIFKDGFDHAPAPVEAT